MRTLAESITPLRRRSQNVKSLRSKTDDLQRHKPKMPFRPGELKLLGLLFRSTLQRTQVKLSVHIFGSYVTELWPLFVLMYVCPCIAVRRLRINTYLIMISWYCIAVSKKESFDFSYIAELLFQRCNVIMIFLTHVTFIHALRHLDPISVLLPIGLGITEFINIV